MSDQNLRLAPFSYLDRVALSITSEATDYPVEYLQNSFPSWLWRSTSTANQVLTGPLDEDEEEVAVNCFAIVNNNLTLDSEIRIELADDAGFTSIVLDVTIDGRLPEFGLGEGGWGEDGFGGYSEQRARQDIRPYWFDEVNAKFSRITLIDPDNEDGYIQAGKIFLGYYWSPTNNAEWGAKHRTVKTTKLKRARGGGIRSSSGARYREISVAFEWLEELDDTALDHMLSLYGKTEGVLLSVYPEEGGSQESKYTLYGVITEWAGSTQQPTRDYANGFTVQESK